MYCLMRSGSTSASHTLSISASITIEASAISESGIVASPSGWSLYSNPHYGALQKRDDEASTWCRGTTRYAAYLDAPRGGVVSGRGGRRGGRPRRRGGGPQ